MGFIDFGAQNTFVSANVDDDQGENNLFYNHEKISKFRFDDSC